MTISEIINIITAFLNGYIIEYRSINSPILTLPFDNESWQTYDPIERPLNFTYAYNGLEVWRIKPKTILTERVGLFQSTINGKRKSVIVPMDKLPDELFDCSDIMFIEWLTDEFSYTINTPTNSYNIYKYRDIIIEWLNNKPIQFKFNNMDIWIDFPNFQYQYLLDNHFDSFLTLFDHHMIQLRLK